MDKLVTEIAEALGRIQCSDCGVCRVCRDNLVASVLAALRATAMEQHRGLEPSAMDDVEEYETDEAMKAGLAALRGDET